jgi:hypothetical protein
MSFNLKKWLPTILTYSFCSSMFLRENTYSTKTSFPMKIKSSRAISFSGFTFCLSKSLIYLKSILSKSIAENNSLLACFSLKWSFMYPWSLGIILLTMRAFKSSTDLILGLSYWLSNMSLPSNSPITTKLPSSLAYKNLILFLSFLKSWSFSSLCFWLSFSSFLSS